eukprot:1463992-Rhodomonas_salina.1
MPNLKPNLKANTGHTYSLRPDSSSQSFALGRRTDARTNVDDSYHSGCTRVAPGTSTTTVPGYSVQLYPTCAHWPEPQKRARNKYAARERAGTNSKTRTAPGFLYVQSVRDLSFHTRSSLVVIAATSRSTGSEYCNPALLFPHLERLTPSVAIPAKRGTVWEKEAKRG